jgi:hypothetical protein
MLRVKQFRSMHTGAIMLNNFQTKHELPSGARANEVSARLTPISCPEFACASHEERHRDADKIVEALVQLSRYTAN